MSKQIAIFIDGNDQTAIPTEAIAISVYIKEANEWKAIKQLPFSTTQLKEIKTFRENLIDAINTLDGCKIIVGKEFSGLAYTVFEQAAFRIVEADGKPEEFLDELLSKIEEYEASLLENAKEFVTDVEPSALDDQGRYYLNLKELQENKSSVTSKQALLPFLKNKTFYELQVICSHEPPWLENELERLKLNKTVEQISANELKIIITKKCCS